MSAEALPITAARFAQALEGLSVSSLHAKANELRNSIAHLQKSNDELEEYVRQDEDKDLYEAILENREVIKRMEERIELLKKEVTEVRCLPWAPEEGARASEVGERPSTGRAGTTTNGVIGGRESAGVQEQANGTGSTAAEEEEGVFL